MSWRHQQQKKKAKEEKKRKKIRAYLVKNRQEQRGAVQLVGQCREMPTRFVLRCLPRRSTVHTNIRATFFFLSLIGSRCAAAAHSNHIRFEWIASQFSLALENKPKWFFYFFLLWNVGRCMVNGVCVCAAFTRQVWRSVCDVLGSWVTRDFYFLSFSCCNILQNHFVISRGAVIFKSPESCYSNDLAGPAVQLWVSREETTDHASAGTFLIGHSCNLHQIFWIKKKQKN